MSSLLRRVGPASIPFFVAAVCFFRLALDPDSLIVDGARVAVDHADLSGSRGVGNDLTSVFLPKYTSVVARLRADRRFPTWDPTGFGGRPLIGNPQAGLLYPPVWLAWCVGRPSALGWLTVGHLVTAGLGVFILLRSLGVSPTSAGLAGGFFEASPYLIAHTFEGHYPHVWSASWYPWAFWAYLLARRNRPAGVLALPLVLALCFLTGHPQEWYYLVLALSAWASVDAVRLGRSQGVKHGAARLALWGALLVVSLAFCAAEVLPEIAAQHWLLKKSVIPLGMVSHYHVRTLSLAQLLHPFALGRPHDYFGPDNYWETVFSFGFLPLMLAAVGVATRRGDRVVAGWLALVLVCVVLAAGRRLGLYSLAYTLLPGMDRFRVPARTLFLASLGVSALAGFGLDGLVRVETSASWDRRRTRLILGLSAMVLVLAAARPGTMDACRSPHPSAGWQALKSLSGQIVVWGVLAGTVALLLLSRCRRTIGYGLGTLALVDLMTTAQCLLVISPVAPFVGPGTVAQRVDAERARSKTSGPTRVAADPRVLSDLEAATLGFELTNVNDGFQIQHAADLYECLYPFLGETRMRTPREGPLDDAVDHFLADVARSVLDVLGVSEVVTARPFPRLGLETLWSAGDGKSHTISRNPRAMPRVYVVPRATVADPGEGELPPAVRLGRFDPREAVWMCSDPLDSGPRQPFTPARWLSDGPANVVVRVTTEFPGLLVIGNTWMPGWRAVADGRPEPVLRGNHWQQVVPLRSEGDHEIVLRYEPPGFRAGLIVSGASGLLWTICVCDLVVRNRGKKRP